MSKITNKYFVTLKKITLATIHVLKSIKRPIMAARKTKGKDRDEVDKSDDNSQKFLDEDVLQELYAWVDQIPLSRKKQNISRDFSDGGNDALKI